MFVYGWVHSTNVQFFIILGKSLEEFGDPIDVIDSSLADKEDTETEFMEIEEDTKPESLDAVEDTKEDTKCKDGFYSEDKNCIPIQHAYMVSFLHGADVL